MRIVAEAWNNLTDNQRERWSVAGPDVPSPVWELQGRPEAGPDAHRLLVILESLDWASEYLPKQ